ncbi:MAG TPA: hypothetical protein V6D48_15605 [Oculatellaceae cyanobacterium]
MNTLLIPPDFPVERSPPATFYWRSLSKPFPSERFHKTPQPTGYTLIHGERP